MVVQKETARKLKVCCFCERWESGGIESFLFGLLQNINLHQMQVDIVVSQLAASIFTEPLKHMGIRFFELSGNTRNIEKNKKMLVQLLEEQQYDVLHFHLFHGMSLYYVFLAERLKIPVRIVHSHNTALRKSISWPIKQVIHQISKALFSNCASELWACSTPAARFLFSKRILKKRGFHFVPNGIDLTRFAFQPSVREEMRKKLRINECLVLGHVGRLCYQKNQSFLLEVFAYVIKKIPKSVLLLVGEGEERQYLEAKSRKLGIFDHVIFCGVCNQIEKLFWAMDIFVMPSHFEGLPITGVEAQATGLPCIFSENITRECKIIPAVTFLSLSSGREKWGNVVIQLVESVGRRQDFRFPPQSNFSIKKVAAQIEQQYARMAAL